MNNIDCQDCISIEELRNEKKEQLYYVEIPLPKKLNGVGRIGQSSVGGLEVLFTKICLLPNRKTKFTESEIKAIDERYWPFAVRAND